jgi:putative transposase
MYLPDRKSSRRSEHDYSSEWCYFVTIVTKNRERYFGETGRDALLGRPQMILNRLGKYCEQKIAITNKMRENVDILECIIMPNHIHCIINICKRSIVGTCGNTSANNKLNSDALPWSDALPCVPTESLWSIVRNIKSRVTKYANTHNIPFARQSR